MEVVGGGGGSRSCILETVDCVEDDRATTITADGEGGVCGGGVWEALAGRGIMTASIASAPPPVRLLDEYNHPQLPLRHPHGAL